MTNESQSETAGDEVNETEAAESLLERYKALVVAEADPQAGIADADGAAYAMALLGLPLIAYSYDWVSSIWAYLGLAIAGPTVGGIGHGILSSTAAWFRSSRVGVRLAHLIPFLLMGLGIGLLFQPSWVGPAFGIFMCASFLISDRNSYVNRRVELERLGLGRSLTKELVSLPVAQLDPWVRTQLEQAFESRVQLQSTLVDTLDDAGIDSFSLMRDVDTAIAEMLDRAIPLSAIIGRGDDASKDAASKARTVFEAMLAAIDEVCVEYMSYASSRDHSKLDILKNRIADLTHTEHAYDEIESYLNAKP
ncbi:MAG: hypothetical protein ACPGQS_00330 [Bradymonadia bacterium]